MPRLVRSFLRRGVALPAALAVALTLAAVGLQAGAAAGPGTPGPPGPVRIVVDGISSAVAAPTGTPGGAVPYVLVEAGQEFFVDVSFYDATGALASFSQRPRRSARCWMSSVATAASRSAPKLHSYG